MRRPRGRPGGRPVALLLVCALGAAAGSVFYSRREADWQFRTSVMTQEEAIELRDEVQEMFQFTYDSYMENAFPMDELRPLSCSGKACWQQIAAFVFPLFLLLLFFVFLFSSRVKHD